MMSGKELLASLEKRERVIDTLLQMLDEYDEVHQILSVQLDEVETQIELLKEAIATADAS